MSEVQASSAPPPNPASGWGATWVVCALVLPLLAMTPLVWLEFEEIAGQRERWFAGLVPLFVFLAMVMVYREKIPAEPDEDDEGGFFKAVKLATTGTAQTRPLLDRPAGPPKLSRARWAVGIVCGALLLFIISVFWSAPWLASVAAVGAFGGWALGRMTRVHWPAIAAWCALLLVALPLPGWWELGLVRWMQWIAGLLAAGVLDLLRVPNLRYGNLFELKGYVLSIEAALRGPFSFYALAGLAAITMYLRGNGLTTTLVKFFTLPLWGILLYTVRLLIILLAQHWYGRDLTQGNDLLLVSAASFTWAYLAYLLWDLLLSIMLGPVPPEVPELARQYNRLNRLLCWPNEVPIDDITPSLAFEQSGESRGEATPAPNRTERTIANWWRLPGLAVPLVGLLLAAGFASLTVAAVMLRGSGSLSAALPELSVEQLALLPSKETLPEKVDSWLRVGFRRDEIEAIERIGPETRAWDYRLGNRLATLRADLPTRGWTDLVHWYAQRGWELEEMVVVPGKLNPRWPWIEMTLVSSYGTKARVCHSVFTANGRPYLDAPAAGPINPGNPVAIPKQHLSDELRQLFGEAAPVTLQIQLFSDTLDVDNKPDLAEFRKLYEQLRERLIQDQAQRSWTFGFEK